MSDKNQRIANFKAYISFCAGRIISQSEAKILYKLSSAPINHKIEETKLQDNLSLVIIMVDDKKTCFLVEGLMGKSMNMNNDPIGA